MWVRGGSLWMEEIDEAHEGAHYSVYLTAVQFQLLPLHLFRSPPPELQRLALFK